MSEYKVKILKPNNWRKYPVGRLDISVGISYHEGSKLEAAVEWARSRFGHVIVSVADMLQRHNYMAEGMAEAEAEALCRREGLEWIERNHAVLDGLQIIHWDERLSHPLYEQYYQRTLDGLKEAPSFKDMLYEEATRYASRKNEKVVRDRVNYLIEEIAVFDMLFLIEPAADVYPGSILPFWEYGSYQEKAAFTRIDFLRRSAA